MVSLSIEAIDALEEKACFVLDTSKSRKELSNCLLEIDELINKIGHSSRLEKLKVLRTSLSKRMHKLL